jgi:hypothetical protein
MDLVRASLRSDKIPVVIGRISDSGRDDYMKEQANGRVWDFGDIVREAQASYVSKDRHAALVTSTDDYGYSDPWHYDSAGYLDLGRKFAEAIHELQSRCVPSLLTDTLAARVCPSMELIGFPLNSIDRRV